MVIYDPSQEILKTVEISGSIVVKYNQILDFEVTGNSIIISGKDVNIEQNIYIFNYAQLEDQEIDNLRVSDYKDANEIILRVYLKLKEYGLDVS